MSKSHLLEVESVLRDTPLSVPELSLAGSPVDSETLPAYCGLKIDGIGAIPLPLTTDERAPIVSQLVAEPPIPADRIHFSNAAWEHDLAKLVPIIANRLGHASVPLEIQLNALIVSTPDHAAHPACNATGDTLATLLIQLPSELDGGQLVITQPDGSSTVTHDFGVQSGQSRLGPHYAVIHTSAKYTVQPVSSGCRLLLDYRLTWPKDHMQTDHAIDPTAAFEKRTKLASALAALAESKTSLHHVLAQEAKLVVDRFDPDILTGTDRAHVDLLRSVNRSLATGSQFKLYFVRVMRVVPDHGFPYEVVTKVCTDDDHNFDVPSELQPKSVHVLGEWINPGGKSKAEVWESGCERAWQELGGGEKLGKTVSSKWVCLMIPDSAGKWEIAQLVGVRQALEILVRRCCITPEDLELVVASLPESLQAAPSGLHAVNHDGMDDWPIHFVTAELLDLMVSRALLGTIPTFFKYVKYPLSAESIHVFVTAMGCCTLWGHIKLPLISALPRIPDAFCLVLKLIHAAEQDGRKADTWSELLSALLDVPVTVDQLDAMCHHLVQSMQEHKSIWHGLAPNRGVLSCVLNAIITPPAAVPSSDSSSDPAVAHKELAFGLRIVCKAIDNGIPEAEWLDILAAVASHDSLAHALTSDSVRLTVVRASHHQQVWQELQHGIVCALNDAASSAGFNFMSGLALALDLVRDHSSNRAVWEPIVMALASLLEASPSAADFEPFFSNQNSQSTLVNALLDTRIWPAIRTPLLAALSTHANKFHIGLALISAAALDTAQSTKHKALRLDHLYGNRYNVNTWANVGLPHMDKMYTLPWRNPHDAAPPAWIDLVPTVFQAPVPHPTVKEMKDHEFQLRLWSVLARAGDAAAVESTVAAYLAAAAAQAKPQLLQPAVRACFAAVAMPVTDMAKVQEFACAVGPLGQAYVDGYVQPRIKAVEGKRASGENVGSWEVKEVKRLRDGDDVEWSTMCGLTMVMAMME